MGAYLFKGGMTLKRDMVNHPSHYTLGNIEVLDFILDKSRFMKGDEAVLFGHIIRYVSRYPHKENPIQDLEKAKFYLNKLIETVKEAEALADKNNF